MSDTPDFTLETFHNEYLPEGSGEVDAIVSVTASGQGSVGATGQAAQVIMIDCSGSMNDPADKIQAAKRATRAALDALPDGVAVAIVAGRHDARMVFPTTESMTVLGPGVRSQAGTAVDRLQPSGGTAIGTWLDLSRRLLSAHPDRIRHAIMLTDGRNEHETPEALAATLSACEGVFTCDARGIGIGWVVEEVRGIASRLLGTADAVKLSELDADFAGIVERAMGRGVADVDLRVWTPRGASVGSVKQVAPSLEDLTDRRTPDPAKPLLGHYPTGAWGDETREYHLRIAVDPLAEGEEMLAARIAVVTGGPGGTVHGESRVRVEWTRDTGLSTRLNQRVAHYTGQAELAEAIQDGLEARRSGDEATATARLGRAVQLAAESGNDETSALLEKVVDVDDPATGRVRLRRAVDTADEMTLDVRSTRTARVRES